ncbi:hypothetical protein ACOSQ3_004464 [Xanthoceras sorbifolium]
MDQITWKMIAAAFDVLSNVFADEILPTLMPINQAKLSASGDEAAVLALGAIAESCLNGLYPHLSEVIICCMILISKYYIKLQLVCKILGCDHINRCLGLLLKSIYVIIQYGLFIFSF